MGRVFYLAEYIYWACRQRSLWYTDFENLILYTVHHAYSEASQTVHSKGDWIGLSWVCYGLVLVNSRYGKLVNFLSLYIYIHATWWHHHMETFSTLLALCEGNPLAIGRFPLQKASNAGFDIFYVSIKTAEQAVELPMIFETSTRPLWRHCNDEKLHYVLLGKSYSVSVKRIIISWETRAMTSVVYNCLVIFRRANKCTGLDVTVSLNIGQ